MKKLLIVFCLWLPLVTQAQDFVTLKHLGDSLKFYAQYPQSEMMYNRAIDRVLNFEEKVTNAQWVEVCAAQQFVHVKANSYTDDKTAAFVNWQYGENGEKIKTKVKELVDAGATCVFTCSRTAELPVLLVWVADKQLYIRSYDSRNIYKPLKINCKMMANLLAHHADDLAHQNIDFDQTTSAESAKIVELKFYTANGVWPKKMLSDDAFTATSMQGNYLCQLLPLLQEQETAYFKRLKTE